MLLVDFLHTFISFPLSSSEQTKVLNTGAQNISSSKPLISKCAELPKNKATSESSEIQKSAQIK